MGASFSSSSQGAAPSSRRTSSSLDLSGGTGTFDGDGNTAVGRQSPTLTLLHLARQQSSAGLKSSSFLPRHGRSGANAANEDYPSAAGILATPRGSRGRRLLPSSKSYSSGLPALNYNATNSQSNPKQHSQTNSQLNSNLFQHQSSKSSSRPSSSSGFTHNQNQNADSHGLVALEHAAGFLGEGGLHGARGSLSNSGNGGVMNTKRLDKMTTPKGSFKATEQHIQLQMPLQQAHIQPNGGAHLGMETGVDTGRRAASLDDMTFPLVVSDLIKALVEVHSIKDCLIEYFDGLRRGDVERSRLSIAAEVSRNCNLNNQFWSELSSVLTYYLTAEKLLTSLEFANKKDKLHSTIDMLERSIKGITRLLDAQIVACSAQERKPAEPHSARFEPWQFGGPGFAESFDEVNVMASASSASAVRADDINPAMLARINSEEARHSQVLAQVFLSSDQKRIVSTQPVKGALEDYATIFSKISQLFKTRLATCQMYERITTDPTSLPLASLSVSPAWRDQLGFQETLEGSSGNKMLQDLIDNGFAELEALTSLAQVRYQISCYSLDGTMLALAEARKIVARLEELATANTSSNDNEIMEESSLADTLSGTQNGPARTVGPFRATIRPHQQPSLAPTNATAEQHFRVAVQFTQRVFNMLAAKATLFFSAVLAQRVGSSTSGNKKFIMVNTIRQFVVHENQRIRRSSKSASGSLSLVLVLDTRQCLQEGVNEEDLSSVKVSKEGKFAAPMERRRVQRHCVLPTRSPNGFFCNPLKANGLLLESDKNLRLNLGIDMEQPTTKILVTKPLSTSEIANVQIKGTKSAKNAKPKKPQFEERTTSLNQDELNETSETAESLFAPLEGVNAFPSIFSFPPTFVYKPHQAAIASAILARSIDLTSSATVIAETKLSLTYIIRKIDPTVHLALIYEGVELTRDQTKDAVEFVDSFFQQLIVH